MHDRTPAQGSVVWIRQRPWLVEQVRRDRDVVRLDVRDRRGPLTFLTPFDTVVATLCRHRRKSVGTRAAAARLAGLRATSYGRADLMSAVAARIDLLGFQLEPALAVLAGVRRVLLADAVGLGKTIQAGVVLAELRRRKNLMRALVVCPAPLRDQWIEELETRFSLACQRADRAALAAVERLQLLGETPWNSPAVWIASSDYLKQPHVFSGIPISAWDLVVIDEAHDVVGHTERHAACDELARRSRQVLLLTATPHSGDERRFERLLAIGSLDGAGDDLVVFRRTRADVGFARTRRTRWHGVPPTKAESTLWEALATYERIVLQGTGRRRRDAALLLLTVYRKRALSSAAAFVRSVERRLEWLNDQWRDRSDRWLQPDLWFEDADEGGGQERAALSGDIGMPGAEERRWLRRLRRLGRLAARRESKVERIAALVARAREPVVIFTEFRDSLAPLQRRLDGVCNHAVLHGGQPASVRRDELMRFLNGEAPVLISTDVGGQGLNLQHRARWTIGLDLPWTPTRLEQRIGRVERIGQVRPVHATLLYARDQAETGLLRILARRVDAARDALGRDTLEDLSPLDEATLGRTLLADEPLPLAYARKTAVPVCGTWRRPAQALTRLLWRRRQLGRRWRAAAHGTRVAVCRAPGVMARIGAAEEAVAVCSVPLVDGTDSVVERHLLVLRIPARRNWNDPLDPALLDAAQTVAGDRLAPRIRRASRKAREVAARMAATEEALVRHLLASRCPNESQPGLFSRREARAFDAAREAAAELADAARARQTHVSRGTSVRVGRPALELLITSQ